MRRSRHGGFDHNAQTLRVVTRLERRYAEFDGLNLTWETLEGVVKHNGPLRRRAALFVAEYCAEHDLELHTPPARGADRGARRRHRLLQPRSGRRAARDCSRSTTSPGCLWSAPRSPASRRAIRGSIRRG